MSIDSVLLTIHNDSTYISGSLSKELYDDLRQELGYRPETADFMIASGKFGDWDGYVTTLHKSKRGCRCPIKKEGVHFPTGLASKAQRFLKLRNVDVRMKDMRVKPASELSLEMTSWFEPRDYQKTVVIDSVAKTRGIVKMATGAGKTATACKLIASLGVKPFVFYVTSIDLLLQAKDEMEKFIVDFSGKAIEVGAIGGGYYDIKDINVVMVQTAIRALGQKYKRADEDDKAVKDSKEVKSHYLDIKNLIMSAKGMIADEVQHWAAETCQIISDYSVNAYYKYGFSATPWRDMGDDILIDACFGRQIADISASKLIKMDYLVKPNIYFVPIKNMRGIKKPTYNDVYDTAIVQNGLRNQWITNIANNFKEKDKKILILVRKIDHGNILSQMLGCEFIHGSSPKKKRKEHIEAMRLGEVPVTISSTIFDEGVDCKPLDTLILAGGGKSATRALQRIGRVIRPYTDSRGNKKTEATIVDFEDNCKYLRAHSNKRLRIYQTEPEFNIEYLNVK